MAPASVYTLDVKDSTVSDTRIAETIMTMTRQSPINIEEKTAKFQAFRSFTFEGYEQLSIAKGTLKVLNTGTTLKLVAEPGVGVLSGGPLNVQYEFVEMHFHWGDYCEDQGHAELKGSEHTFNGKSFPLELHMVHKNIHDETVGDALLHENGLCVLGFVFDVVESDIPIHGLNKLARIVGNLGQAGATFDLANLRDLNQEGHAVDLDVNIANFFPSRLEEYFTYKGSLTTGGYEEAVNWVVFRNPLAIKKEHLGVFQTLLNSGQEPIKNNYRNTMPTFDRPIYYSGEELLAREVIKAVGVSTKNNSGKVGGNIPRSIQALSERFWRKVGMKMVEPAPVAGDGIARVALASDAESSHEVARER